MATPPRPASGVVRVAFSGIFNGTKWANVMHVFVAGSSAGTQANADQLAIDMISQYFIHFCPVLSLQFSIDECNLVWFLTGGNVLEASAVSPGAGQDSGVTLPANVALVISWRTSNYYRGGHPRTYLSGIVQDRLADSKSWSAQTIADFSAAAGGFRTSVNNISLQGSSSVRLGYLQQFANGGSTKNPREYLDPPVFHEFVGHSVHSRVDSQRRRLGRESST